MSYELDNFSAYVTSASMSAAFTALKSSANTWAGGQVYGDGVGNEFIAIDGAAGALRYVEYRSSGVARWRTVVNGSAESGGNVGSGFEVRSFDDAGTLIGTPFSIARQNGNVSVSADVNITGALTVGTTAKVSATLSVGAIVINGTLFDPATYATSNSLSAAIATRNTAIQYQDEGVNLGAAGAASTVNFVGTGISASLTGAILTVTAVAGSGSGEGSVSISDMISSRLAVHGGKYLLGSANLSAQTTVRFSGSWSDYACLELWVSFRTAGGSGTASAAIYTDGGTTPFLQVNNGTSSAGTAYQQTIYVQQGSAYKSMRAERANAATTLVNYTATANSDFINCIQFGVGGTSNTLSVGVAQLYGVRR